MRVIRNTTSAVFLLILCQTSLRSFGQLGIPITIEKPKEYEERVLRSEKSDQKKFTVPRRFIQNTVTHYNYFFNANNKLNEVLEKAKLAFKDDYSQLLAFYNYSLDNTIQDSIQLDSITYKASTGIALHDLRNDWVDNLYLLWGAAFYLQKKFDSAYLMFQFINYAFAPKEKDGYYVNIGSGRDGNSAFSISTKEKNSLPRKIFSEPPSRNDAFIWQIRNFLAQDQLPEAASLIITLKNDPAFPKRLDNDLHEVQSYWFYKQGIWDSAAVHLEKALSNATNKQEMARWEYLVAQLYELAGNYKDAEKFYGKVSKHTTDLVMDIYAQLASIRVNKDDGEKTIEKNVAELLKMAKRDRYEEYRDIIYYMAAQMQLQANNTDAALALLLKSTEFNSNNMEQRNKIFLQLADISFTKKFYRQAANFYDSLNMSDPAIKNPEAIDARKSAANLMATNIEIIARQDSLQRVAAMPEDERKDFIKKLVRQLRKLSGLKDETPFTTGSPFTNPSAPADIFTQQTQKGEWYFYNSSSRTRGQNEFRSKWGTRPNVDNWRRSATILKGSQLQTSTTSGGTTPGSDPNATGNGDITYDALFARLPISPEQLKQSNDSIKAALFALGKGYIQEIEDCGSGTETLEHLRSRFPEFQPMDEVLFNLYYCYNKNGETNKAAAIKKLLSDQYSNSNFTTIITTGKNPQSTSANPEATKAYEEVYDLFVEGRFAEAIEKKKTADGKFGKSFWTPQLLYIESVYYIKQREDSTAKNVLNAIINQFPSTPLAAKATAMINVLNRRAQIEEELRNLNITRYGEDTTSKTPVAPVVINPPPKADTGTNKPKPVVNTNVPKPLADTTGTKAPANTTTPYSFVANTQHYVVLVLNKVDPVYCNEAKNAFFRYNRETYYNKTFTLDLFTLDNDNKLLLTSPFTTAQEAIDYVDKTKPKTANEIIPWLKGGKYSFLVISQNNLDLLKGSKDVEAYRTFINQHFPGKF